MAQLTRTQLRRAQRAHTARCYKIGALQRVHHSNELCRLEELLCSPEAVTLLTSVAVHRADCWSTAVPHHYAASSNLHAASLQFKSSTTFKRHRALHKRANAVKHDVPQDLGHSPAGPQFVPFSGKPWNIDAAVFTPGLPSHSVVCQAHPAEVQGSLPISVDIPTIVDKSSLSEGGTSLDEFLLGPTLCEVVHRVYAQLESMGCSDVDTTRNPQLYGRVSLKHSHELEEAQTFLRPTLQDEAIPMSLDAGGECKQQ